MFFFFEHIKTQNLENSEPLKNYFKRMIKDEILFLSQYVLLDVIMTYQEYV